MMVPAGIFILVLFAANPLKAHEGGAVPADVWEHWNLDPVLFAGLLLSLYLFGRGAATYRVERWRMVTFFIGLAALFVALISPLDALSHSLFSAHMIQHLLLILVAAPLLTLSQPLSPLLRGLPQSWRRLLGTLANWRRLRLLGNRLTYPLSALVLHITALWLWHVPGLYGAALNHPVIHMLEHASFFMTAVLFWLMISRTRGYGGRVLAAFSLMMASGLLGALMTFSSTPWYADHADTVPLWGMTPLSDQQLAGVVMWIPMGMVYVVTAAVLLTAWLNAVERQVIERERRLLEEVRDG